MKKMMIMMAVLCVAAVANAAVTVDYTFTPAGDFHVAADPPAGYAAYIVTLTSSDGSLISAVDIDTGSFGLTGNLLQLWSESWGTYTPTPTGEAFPPNFEDSHMLLGAEPVVAVAASEDNGLGLGMNATFERGLGTYLTAAWGIPGGDQAASLDIAYIVTNDIGGVSVAGLAATQTGTYAITPEPMTLSLLAIGGALVAIKRKRS